RVPRHRYPNDHADLPAPWRSALRPLQQPGAVLLSAEIAAGDALLPRQHGDPGGDPARRHRRTAARAAEAGRVLQRLDRASVLGRDLERGSALRHQPIRARPLPAAPLVAWLAVL